jgi:hypothetical protein
VGWLFLLPPLLALGLVVAASIQPVQFGSVVLASEWVQSPGSGWKVKTRRVSPTDSATIHNHEYQITGEGPACVFSFGDWVWTIGWFQGERQE